MSDDLRLYYAKASNIYVPISTAIRNVIYYIQKNEKFAATKVGLKL